MNHAKNDKATSSQGLLVALSLLHSGASAEKREIHCVHQNHFDHVGNANGVLAAHGDQNTRVRGPMQTMAAEYLPLAAGAYSQMKTMTK